MACDLKQDERFLAKHFPTSTKEDVSGCMYLEDVSGCNDDLEGWR